MTDYKEICKELNRPLRHDHLTVNRRRFLQFSAVGAGTTAAAGLLSAPGAMAETLNVQGAGSGQGIVVVVGLRGGNDGLNTVIPVDSGAYHDLRPRLGYRPDEVHRIGSGLGLHPALGLLKQRYDNGQVAIVQGIGMGTPNLSHFESTERWMFGSSESGRYNTGWLGRWMDGADGLGDLGAVSLGSNLSQQFVGSKRQGVAIPSNGNLGFFAGDRDYDASLQQGIRSFADGSTGWGYWGDQTALAGREAVDTAKEVSSIYQRDSQGSGFARMMAVAARMVSADVGVRLLDMEFGGFDHHSSQDWQLDSMLGDLDEGIERFFAELDPVFASRVTLLINSEFGRRPQENGSGGTDHGTSNCAFVIGSKVRGGLHGAYPSLSGLDSRGNMVASVDYRSVYSTILDKWLRGDSREILGANFEYLNLFASGPGNTDVVRKAPKPGARDGYVLVTAGGGLHNFGHSDSFGGSASSQVVGIVGHPGGNGYWIATADGGVEGFGSAGHYGSMRNRGLNGEIVDIAATPGGSGYWLLGEDGGVFSFGDAAFYGSTGSIVLNQPVVGMAASPGRGYWFVAADGGIFAYGKDAQFYGSTGAMRLNSPITAMAATKTGKGYWLAASDGGIFAYGDAEFYGSTGDIRLVSPMVGISSTASGKGYWLVSADGGIFSFGDAEFEGSVGGGGQAVVGFATT